MNDKDIIKRQQEEIERLTIQKNAFGAGMKVEARKNDDVKSEAIKEFEDKVNREITEAIISNDKAISEREKKHNVNRHEDNFCAMCDGKVIALCGIRSFINDIVKEMLGKEDEGK